MSFIETFPKWIVAILVLLLFLVIYFLGDGSLFTEIKATTDDVTDVAGLNFGAKEIITKKITLPKEHEQAIRKLVDNINIMTSSNKSCYMQYGPLPELNKEGTTIELTKGSITIKSLGGKQVVTDLTKELRQKLNEYEPCVNVRGKDEKFNNLVTNIVINYDGENKINFNEFNSDLEDLGWIYTPDGNKICFYPTYDGDPFGICDSDNSGVDDDCMIKLEPYFKTKKCQ